MTIQYSIAVRNAKLDAVETAIGTSPILKLRTGSVPATCATADSGTVIATMTLPSDWMSAAASAIKSLLGTWQDASADATGTPAHFRIYESTGVTCHIQGTVTFTGSGGDMTIDVSGNVTAAQQVNVTTFAITAGNA